MLIRNPAKTRPYWPLSRVLSLNVGDDGNVRSANLKKDGNNQTHSIKHLFTMELSTIARLGMQKLLVRPQLTLKIQGRRRSKRFCTKKKQSDQNDPYMWY